MLEKKQGKKKKKKREKTKNGTTQIKNKNRVKITRDKCRQNCQYFHRRKKETGKGKIAKRGTAIKVILMERKLKKNKKKKIKKIRLIVKKKTVHTGGWYHTVYLLPKIKKIKKMSLPFSPRQNKNVRNNRSHIKVE